MKFQRVVILIVLGVVLTDKVHGSQFGQKNRSGEGVQRGFLEKFYNKEGPAPELARENAGLGSWFGFGESVTPTQQRHHKEKSIVKKVKVKPLDYGYITSLGPFFKTSFPKPSPGYGGGGYYVWSWR